MGILIVIKVLGSWIGFMRSCRDAYPGCDADAQSSRTSPTSASSTSGRGHAKRAGNIARRVPGVEPVAGKLTDEELEFIVRLGQDGQRPAVPFLLGAP